MIASNGRTASFHFKLCREISPLEKHSFGSSGSRGSLRGPCPPHPTLLRSTFFAGSATGFGSYHKLNSARYRVVNSLGWHSFLFTQCIYHIDVTAMCSLTKCKQSCLTEH